MKRSQIFDEYAKLAEERGLVSNAEGEKEKSKARRGSDDISTIEALYGVKPEGNDTKHIMEQAHPDSLVLAPSYDKLNGLVENNIERHTIMVNIVGRNPDGFSNQKKYAEASLLRELVCIANDLDNHGHDDLRLLADECIAELSGQKKIVKEALAPLAIAGIVAGCAAVLGGIYLVSHMDDANRGLAINCDNAIAQVDSFLTDNGSGFFGTTFSGKVKGEFLTFLKKLKSDLLIVKKAIAEYATIKSDIQMPRTTKDLKQMGANKGAIAQQKMNAFKAVLEDIGPEILQVIERFHDEGYKHEQYEEESALSRYTGRLGDMLYGGKGVVNDKFDKVRQALAPLAESMKASLDFIDKELPRYQQATAEKLALSNQFKSNPAAPATVAPPSIPEDAMANGQPEDKVLMPER